MTPATGSIAAESCPQKNARPARHAAVSKRQGYRQAFGNVLQADADRQRHRGPNRLRRS